MNALPDFARLVPGFDFLKGLMQPAAGALPALNQWIAPTVDPQELDKRIEQLKTVQFWLEQNARMLGATVQALEVQRMTLSTLKTMNVPVAELSEALKMRAPAPAAAPVSAPPPAPAPATEPASDEADAPATKARPRGATGKSGDGAAPAAGADAVQWWSALTQQFSELAAKTMRDLAAEAGQAAAAPLGSRAKGTAAGKANDDAAPTRAKAKATSRAKPSTRRKSPGKPAGTARRTR